MNYDENEIYNYLVKEFISNDKQELIRAINLAIKYHEGQERVGGQPYIIHPLWITWYAYLLGISDDNILEALLLHDVIEDCDVEIEDLKVNKIVEKTLLAVTHVRNKEMTRAESRKMYFDNLSNDKNAVLVKAFDRYHNVMSMAGNLSKKSIKRNIKETREVLFPIIEKAKEKWPEYKNIFTILKINIQSVIEAIEEAS